MKQNNEGRAVPTEQQQPIETIIPRTGLRGWCAKHKRALTIATVGIVGGASAYVYLRMRGAAAFAAAVATNDQVK